MNILETQVAHVRNNVQMSSALMEKFICNVTHDQGNSGPSLLMLTDHAYGSALLSWFARHDLAALRQWLYTAARLDQAYYRRVEDRGGSLGKTWAFVKPLVSNHPGMIRWFAECDMIYDLKQVENVRTWDYLTYQAPLALRGDWDRLARRSQVAMDYLSATKSKAKYLPDQEFFLALASQDRPGMEAALEKLTQPKLIRSRINDEHGFAETLISTPAVVYAKIAWLHGHEVKVNTPLVPAEWLPMEPLPRYEEQHAFLSLESVG